MTFPSGIYYYLPHDRAPEFVKGKLKIDVIKFKEYLRTIRDEQLLLDIKISKEGKPYLQVDEWKPERTPDTVPVNVIAAEPVKAVVIEEEDELPF